MSEAERKFVRDLITLAARIKNLQYDIPNTKVSELRAEAEACRLEMERLNLYADQNDVDIHKFHRELDDIVGTLEAIDDAIAEKEATTSIAADLPIWGQMRNALSWILNLLWGWIRKAGRVLVLRTIRFLVDTAFPQLPPPREEEPNLLTDGRNKN
jgi:hypothetical protein